MIHGEEKVADSERDDGRASHPPLESLSLGTRMTSVDVHDLPGRCCGYKHGRGGRYRV